jgi:ADP-ribosyl-[dinitrogen reductase] hydrolase
MATKTMAARFDQIAGALLGSAIGDALGLPREGLSRRRAHRMFGGPPLRFRLLLGHGMVSDDTEHACMVGQALLSSPTDPKRFARSLAWRLRFWLLGLPAGIGRATLLGIVKLWFGWSPENSGVFSAGNGPAMRAPLLGVCLGGDRLLLKEYLRASTRITHTDPKAESGAKLVALAAHHGAACGPKNVRTDSFLQDARAAFPEIDDGLWQLLAKGDDHLKRNASAAEFADAIGLQSGVTGYINHTIPVALYCWLRSPGDFRQAVEEVIALGGDTDTTAAIVGSLVGATVGFDNLPADLLGGLWEWPRSVFWMRRLAERLARQFPAEGNSQPQRPLRLFWPGLLVRNLVFLLVVLIHGFRRLLPPY